MPDCMSSLGVLNAPRVEHNVAGCFYSVGPAAVNEVVSYRNSRAVHHQPDDQRVWEDGQIGSRAIRVDI